MATFPVSFNVRAAAWKGLRLTACIIACISLVLPGATLNLSLYSNWILAVAFVAAGVFLLRPAMGARKADLFSPACLFPAVYCFWFGIGSLDILPASLQFSLFEPIPLRMWGYYAVGLAGYLLAVGFAGKEMQRQQDGTGLSTTWDSHRFALAMSVLILIGAAAYAYLVNRGGIPILREDWAESRVEIGRENGLAFTVFLCSFWIVIPMLFVFLWTKPRNKIFSVLTYGLAALLGLSLFSMGSRGFAFVPALIVIIVRHYLVRPWKFARLAVVGIVLFTLIGIAGYMRDYSEVTALSDMGFPVWTHPLAPGYLYVRGPIAAFRDISTTMSMHGNFQYGALSLSPFAVLAPGHHLSSDLFFKKVLGHDFLGFGEPSTLLGVFYADFGTVGIFAGMFATGLLARWLYHRASCGRSLLSVLLFSYFSYVLLFSLFGTLFPYLSTLWIPLVFAAVDMFALNLTCTARGQA